MFVLSLIQRSYIDGVSIDYAVSDSLGASIAMGLHTSVNHCTQSETRRYIWSDQRGRPWGKPLPILCPNCGIVSNSKNLRLITGAPNINAELKKHDMAERSLPKDYNLHPFLFICACEGLQIFERPSEDIEVIQVVTHAPTTGKWISMKISGSSTTG